jgi:crossover junction endodeoxyribonuclease RuvC
MSGEVVLGIDPGLRTTGYGLLRAERGRLRLVEAGVVRAGERQPIEQRLKELYEGLRELLEQHPCHCMAIEQLYSHYERPQTAILMGHARGVLCLAAAQSGLSVHSYEATRVKKTLTGSGRAPKAQVQAAIQQQLNLTSVPPPDVADALAVAICHHYSRSPAVDAGSTTIRRMAL